MKKFVIPEFYRSPIITAIKQFRKSSDQMKRDLSPTVLQVGKLELKIARHFGFCYGVENAIEIAFRAINENPGKRVFLLSEMIHNPMVNADLQKRGVAFLMRTDGTSIIPFAELRPDDIVIVPAFGTTREMFADLQSIGLTTKLYNATCPFVEKVWNRSQQLGRSGHTIVIHGKQYHEETKATFSHAQENAPSIVIRNLDEASKLARYFSLDPADSEGHSRFYGEFAGRYSPGFSPSKHLRKLGVVNQTTMLAGETEAITAFFKEFIATNGISIIIADTKDTLCYATSENQAAVNALAASGGDLAIVVGGHNSSNTSHLAKLCNELVPTFHIEGPEDIVSLHMINHFAFSATTARTTTNWLPDTDKISILISAGASSPDSLVDSVIERLCEAAQVSDLLGSAVSSYTQSSGTVSALRVL